MAKNIMALPINEIVADDDYLYKVGSNGTVDERISAKSFLDSKIDYGVMYDPLPIVIPPDPGVDLTFGTSESDRKSVV